MHEIFFSIITINLNNKAGLAKTIESVIYQTYTNFEYIVIDGASIDGSKEIIEHYQDHIAYLISEPDNGIYHAMNKGIRAARGDYLLFLNSGDLLFDSSTLLRASTQLQSDELVSIATGNTLFSSDKGKHFRGAPEKISFDWLLGAFLPHSSTFILKRMFVKYGMYNEGYRIVSDWEFFLRVLIYGDEIYEKLNFVVSVFDTSGISSRKDMRRIHLDEKREVISNQFGSLISEHIFWLTMPRNLLGSPRLKMLREIESCYYTRGLLHILMKFLIIFVKKIN